LYYQNAPNHIYNYPESVCDSYDAAIEYIQEKLSKYGLESRVGWNCNNSEEPDMVTVFVEHRDGIRQDVPLNSIASAELTDKMYWGINSQFLTTESNSDISESTKLNSIYGVWDSGDGDTRLRFYNATGSDVAVSDGRLIEVEGTLTIINFRTGEKEYGSYILDEDAIMLVLNTKQYKFNCSLENDELIIDDDTFYRVDDVIVNQLIGTWENDDLKIEFGERDELKMYDKTGNRSAINGIYAILNESELWLSNEYEGTTSITNYSVDGGVLDCNGKKLYRNGIGKENIVGTWVNNDDSLGKYYVLNTDGSYEYYLTEQSYSLGRPEEEGTYEIANENDIYFYQNDYRFAYTYLEYNVDGTLSNSSGKQYTKIQ
jgi:hypothetical protein